MKHFKIHEVSCNKFYPNKKQTGDQSVSLLLLYSLYNTRPLLRTLGPDGSNGGTETLRER